MTKNHYTEPGVAIWAHTSPVYVTGTGQQSEASVKSATYFNDRIGEGINWVKTKGRFYTDGQRKEVVDLFKHGQDWYRNLI